MTTSSTSIFYNKQLCFKCNTLIQKPNKAICSCVCVRAHVRTCQFNEGGALTVFSLHA